MSKSKSLIALAVVLIMIFSLFGCSNSAEDSSNESTTDSSSNQVISEDDMFTDRDYDSSYDESSAVKISLSDKNIDCQSESVTVSDSTVTIGNEGTYILSGSLSNGQVVVDAGKDNKVQLVLNSVDINCDTSAAIYVKQADKVFITVADSTNNSLSNKSDFVAIDDNNIDAVVFSKDTLTFNGNGELSINAAYGKGIASKNSVKFTSGTYDINAVEHAVRSKDSIRVAGGTLNITTNEDGFHSVTADDDETDSNGFVYIIGGTMNISSDDDGIHADKSVTIKGGTINVTKSYEGIEGETIDISGGEITVTSSDDGFNAASSSSSDQGGFGGGDPFSGNSDCSINITDGTIKIDAEGDGIDSNGTLTISGGEIYVDGPTSGGNSAIDSDSTATINGGTVVAIGTADMAENFSDGTQCAMLVGISGSAGDTISLKDSSGNELVSYVAGKAYSCAVISCPEIKSDQTYTIAYGDNETEITMSDTFYTNTGMGGMNGNMGSNMGGATPSDNGQGNGNMPDNGGQMGGEMPNGNGQMGTMDKGNFSKQ